MKKDSKEIIEKLKDDLFLKEPLMFDVLCTHKIQENPGLEVMFRTGHGCIEYNPELIKKNSRHAEGYLKQELIRILLKHPYQRVPKNPNRVALKEASDITIYSICDFKNGLTNACYYNLEDGLSYEEYYKTLKEICREGPGMGAGEGEYQDEAVGEKEASENSRYDNNSSESFSGSQSAEYTELWGENEEMCEKIDRQIEKAAENHQWGSLRGSAQEVIQAKRNIRMDYKKILRQFRTSVLSTSRSLTRFRPNRRYGFEYMGSRYQQLFNLLVAVDSSGSIDTQDLENFFSIINKFFKYGTRKMKVLVFDAEIQQELDYKKAMKEIEIKGRGGTDFQPVIDYYENTDKYDGMIVLTDGCAPLPQIHRNKKILWLINNRMNYNYCKKLGELPGSSLTWIPHDAADSFADSYADSSY